LLVILLAASGANDAAKFPLGKAAGTDHGAGAAIAHLSQYAEGGLAAAERTKGIGGQTRA
jgi:hypothetical protein